MKRLVTLALVVALVAGGLAGTAVAQETTPTATETASPTPTPTPDGQETGSNGSESPANQSGLIAADVYVEQPRWVSQPVEQSSASGLSVYSVRGQTHELEPQQFNQSAVIRAGVREDAATLTYDKGIGRWVLDSQGTAGSYRVFWVVRENGQTQTYAATIDVTKAEFKHVEPATISGLEDRAEFAETIFEEFESAGIINDDASQEEALAAIEDAITWYKFYLSPLSALSGQFTTLAIMLVSWPAGWIIFGVLFLIYFIRDRKKTKENRRLKRQFADIEDVDEAERRAWERELKRSLSMKTFQDLGLTSTDAQAIREHFDISNPRQFLDKLRSWMDETQWAAILLAAHDQVDGHYIEVERDDGDVVDADLVTGRDPMASDGGVESFGQSRQCIQPGEATEDIIRALDWSQLDPGVLWRDDIDGSAIDWPIANGPAEDREDLVDAFGVPIGEDGKQMHILERREEFADIILTVIKEIAATQHCDDEGRVRPEMEMLDFLYTFTSVGSEKYRWPLHNTADILLRNIQRLDSTERMDEMTSRSRDGEL